VSPRSDTAAPPRAERDPAVVPPVAGGPSRRAIAIAFGLALGVLLLVVVVLLSQHGRRLAGTNNIYDRYTVVRLAAGGETCDHEETIPAGTAFVRLTVDPAGMGAPLTVQLRDASDRVLARGRLAGGWSGQRVDIPVPEVRRTLPDANVCIAAAGKLWLRGYSAGDVRKGTDTNGKSSPDSIRLAYVRAGSETWWSILPAVAHRMGLDRGRLFDGTWMFLAWVALLLALAAVVTVAAVRGLSAAASLRRIPAAGWLCALVALISGTAWALITPAFHVPDEVSHLAYAQYLAETGKLPKENGKTTYAPEEEQALAATEFYMVVGDVDARPPWTEVRDRAMDAERPANPVGSGTAQSATNNPPLYYAMEAAPYWIGKSLGLRLLDRLMLMRFLSVLCAAVTALATFLFVREVLPTTPWAWTVGGLVAALQPLFGFVSAGVQGDALLYTAGAVLLLCLARAFRRGLTPARGAAIGGAIALGLMAKLTFLGLVPGAALGVLLMARRQRAWRGLAIAGAISGAVVVAYALANRFVFDRPLLAGGTGVPAPAGGGAAASLDPVAGISYIWQLYLPRLPFMSDQFPGANPMPHLWLHGIVGRFGWLDAKWPDAVYSYARWALVALVVLAAVELVRAAVRGDLAGRWGELATYAAVAGGLLVLIGWAGYRARVTGAPGFEQARYLLPLLPLYGAGVALAARLWGPRRGPVVAAVLVGVALSHDVLAQLLTVSRFYG